MDQLTPAPPAPRFAVGDRVRFDGPGGGERAGVIVGFIPDEGPPAQYEVRLTTGAVWEVAEWALQAVAA